MARFTDELYSFMHESAANDDHSVEDTLSWLGSLLSFAQEETLDLAPLLESLDSATYELLLNELDQVVAFYNYRAALRAMSCNQENETEDDTDSTTTPATTNLQEIPRPNLAYIPLLVDNFVTMIKPHLSQQETTTVSEDLSGSALSRSHSSRTQLDTASLDTLQAPLAATPQL
jgi:hypothetical protein